MVGDCKEEVISMKKTILGALLMAITMMVLPVSQADAGLKLPGVKINLPGNNKGPAPTTPAKVANSISGKFIGPDGAPMKRAQAIFALSPLAIEKQDVRWFLKPARLGISSGRVDDNGNVTIPGQAGQTYDIILWLKGYEPVVVKNVTCPANIGTQQSSGKNETLREIFEDHRR